MKVIILLGSIVIGLGIVTIMGYIKGKKVENANKILIEYLKKPNGKLFKWLEDKANEIGPDMVGMTKELSFFSIFEYEIIDELASRLNEYIITADNPNYLFGFPSSLNIKKTDIIVTECIRQAAGDILNDQKFTTVLSSIFTKKIAENAEESLKIEKDAIEYNNTFGVEPTGDPVLHKAEKKNSNDSEAENDSSNDAENDNNNLDALISTGTVEDIE